MNNSNKRFLKSASSDNMSDSYYDFRDDMMEAITGVYQKYNMYGENSFDKDDLMKVLDFMDAHGFWDNTEEDNTVTNSCRRVVRSSAGRGNLKSIKTDINKGVYDESIKNIEFRENDDGEQEPHDDDLFYVADQISSETGIEDRSDFDQMYDSLIDLIIDRAYALHDM